LTQGLKKATWLNLRLLMFYVDFTVKPYMASMPHLEEIE
jgi:hypothetical protein